MAAPRYVAVEGLIGVGKTTLVTKLAERLAARPVFEEFENNPFLPDFYKDPAANAFKTQIFFLMSRFRQQLALAQVDLFAPGIVSDYFFPKDRIFAVRTLLDHELALYDRLYEVLALEVPRPDLVVHLVADVDVVLERIRARGRPYEQAIEPSYLRDLEQGYQEFFADYRDAPVLRVNTSEVDLRADDSAFDALVDAVLGRAPLAPSAPPLFARSRA